MVATAAALAAGLTVGMEARTEARAEATAEARAEAEQEVGWAVISVAWEAPVAVGQRAAEGRAREEWRIWPRRY
jgi:hypothetical protein